MNSQGNTQVLTGTFDIPEETRRRDGRYQDAARLYIYGDETGARQTILTRLASRCNLSPTHLVRVRKSDGWDDFAAEIQARRRYEKGDAIEALLCGRTWTLSELTAIDQEREKQREYVSALQRSREKAFLALEETKPESATCKQLLANIEAITKAIEAYTGKDAYDRLVRAKYQTALKVLERGALDGQKGNRLPEPEQSMGAVLEELECPYS